MKDKLLRKLVPSVPILARTPLALLLDISDHFIKIRHPEYSHLPPASLRIRIGVGNKLLRNHSQFIKIGKHFIQDMINKQLLNSKSRILEIGCGCGRLAMEFSKILDKDGYYIGQDIDREMIEWCQKHLQDNRIHFEYADIFSAVYNPHGLHATDYEFPLKNNSVNLIVATSVFTHLLYHDFSHYIKECDRILSTGGYIYASFFIMDYIKSSLGDRWSFQHKQNNCYVENLKYPEAAISYDLEVIRHTLFSNNFSITEIFNKDSAQQIIIAKKG